MLHIYSNFREWLKAKLRDLYHAQGEDAPDLDKCPLTAPWPPGVQNRVVEHPLHGPMLQLRDGATVPPKYHNLYREVAAWRFPKSYSLN